MKDIQYHNPKVDNFGFTHSIDMVYIEYFAKCSCKSVLETIRSVREQFPDIQYREELDRKPSSKYDFYLDMVIFGHARIDMGKYTNYDKTTKSFDLLDMFQLRVNPNKWFDEPWFQALLTALLDLSAEGHLRKYDYAIDISVHPRHVSPVGSRKEPGLFKGTRYLGQMGKHGYVKVYDKQKEIIEKWKKVCDEPLTRVEYTLFTSKKPSLDTFVVFAENNLNEDLSGLTDTDKALVEMYQLLKANNIHYDLKIGRRKMDKLKSHIVGDYVTLDYSLLDSLLALVESDFICKKNIPQIVDDMQTDDFMELDEDFDELPFF